MPTRFRPVRVGELRTRIALASPVLATGIDGAQSAQWLDQGEVWAQWINAHGPEAVVDDATQSLARATVTLRYRADVTPSWTVLKNGQRYAILSLDAIQERGAWLELQVQAYQASL